MAQKISVAILPTKHGALSVCNTWLYCVQDPEGAVVSCVVATLHGGLARHAWTDGQVGGLFGMSEVDTMRVQIVNLRQKAEKQSAVPNVHGQAYELDIQSEQVIYFADAVVLKPSKATPSSCYRWLAGRRCCWAKSREGEGG
jgi:hypothetical protein